VFLAVMVAQAAVGYTQYFTHLPALLVEVHILGATVLVVGAVQCFLACTFHPTEQVTVPAEERQTGAGVPIGAR
jgi:cytochrome c oxidase assembly protein subunit 15